MPKVAFVRVERRGTATRITLDCPANRNALSVGLLEEFTRCAQAADVDPGTRAVVVTSAGPLFSAGADLKDEPGASAKALTGLFDTLGSMSKPVIADVRGDAYGAAVAVIGACDIAVATEGVGFVLPEVRWGLVPTLVALQCVPKMRPSNAMEMMLTGERFSAHWARAAGLVTRVVTSEEADATVDGITTSLGKGGPYALAQSKMLCHTIWNEPVRAIDVAMAIGRELDTHPESSEGVTAFREKRKPVWQAELESFGRDATTGPARGGSGSKA